MNYFSRLGFSALFSSLDEQAFIELNADSYIMGYESKITTLSKFSEPFTNVKSPDKVGLMSQVSSTLYIELLQTYIQETINRD